MGKREKEREREREKYFDFISKHWFQFSGAFASDYVSGQLPNTGRKQSSAVAGWPKHQGFLLRL